MVTSQQQFDVVVDKYLDTFKKQIVLTLQGDGRWYGRIPDSNDGHGNELDAMLDTPEETLAVLLKCINEICISDNSKSSGTT